MSASQIEMRAPARPQWRRLCLPSFALAALTALIVWAAVADLLQHGQLKTVLSAGWAELAAPLLVALVVVTGICERIWPAEPRPVSFLDLSGPHSRGTHWVGFTVGTHAYLSTGTADSRPTNRLDDQFPVIVDLARPDRPAEVGRWWLPGTQQGDGSPPPVRHEVFDAGFRAHNINVCAGRPDRAYVGYLDAGAVILDISDATSPAMVSRLDYHPPMPGFTHTVLPLPRSNLLAISDESVHDAAADYPKLVWFADVSHETSPLIISSAPMPPVAEFAHRGGRFGAHNLHENEPFAWSWQDEDIVFGSFFNAGVRAYDVRNPFQPAEVAAFVPPAPPGSRTGAAQINDVYVAADGIVYAVDRGGGGLYLLQFEGTP